jgi:hypothetical protein
LSFIIWEKSGKTVDNESQMVQDSSYALTSNCRSER